jgi:hypothetical protein
MNTQAIFFMNCSAKPSFRDFTVPGESAAGPLGLDLMLLRRGPVDFGEVRVPSVTVVSF